MNRKKIIKILFTLSAIVILLFAILVGLAYAFEDQIKSYAIKQIESKIGVAIKVDKIELSFIQKFPMASLSFKNITIGGSNDSAKSPDLLHAATLFLKFNIIDVFKGNYNVKEIDADRLQLNFIVFKNQKDNYHIFKENSDTSNSLINLEKINFDQSTISYSNYYNKQFLSFYIQEANSKILFNNDFVDLGFNGDGKIEFYRIDKTQLVENKPYNADLEIRYLFARNSIQFRKSILSYNSIPIEIKGDINNLDKEADLNLTIHGVNTKIESLVNEFPKEERTLFEAYKPTGNLTINASIIGILSGLKFPKIEANVNLRNGSFVYNNNKISSINFDAFFKNGKQTSLATSSLELINLTALFSSGRIEGNISVLNLIDSKVTAVLNGKLNLKVINELLQLKLLDQMSGIADVKSNISVNIQNLSTKPILNFQSLSFTSDILLRDATIKLKSTDALYSQLNGSIYLDKENIRIENLSGFAQNHAFDYTGKIDFNLLKFITNFPQTYAVNGSVNLSSFAMNELDTYLGKSDPNQDSKLPEDLFINLNVNLDTFYWDNLVSLKNFSQLILSKNGLFFNNTSGNTCGGNIKGNIRFSNLQKGGFLMESNSDLSKINISTFFKAFKNFDQNYITDKNLKGILTSKLNLSCRYTKDWDIISSSILATASVSIENGELNDVQELNALSSYTKIKDFSKIQFSQLTNTLKIRNDSIFFPEMEIKSDKLNLNVYGTHTFENSYDYHFKVLLNEILAKKIDKVKVTEFGDVIDDGYGRTTIFLHLTGKGENFNVKYDKAAAGKKIQNDLKKEKENIKTILKSEFKWGKSDTTKVMSPTKIENNQIKKQEEGKFIIEWEEK